MVNLTELQNKSSVLIDEVIQIPRPNTTDKYGRTLPDLKFVPIIERVNNRYHIKLIKFVNDLNHKQICGYMYFTYDADEKISEFFGVKVEKKFRNLGMADYLISLWIDVCLGNGVETLCTIDKQRKPILLYSLKKYSFEIKDPDSYCNGNGVLICDKLDRGIKSLCFPDDISERDFKCSSINRETSHSIISMISDDYIPVDIILLNTPYYAQDLGQAGNISKRKIKSFPARLREKYNN